MSTNTDKFNIWEDTSVGEKVYLTPYLAEGKASPAIIVCPGGSYFWLGKKTEGHMVARWLQSCGISAFLLEYRVGGIGGFITHHRLFARGNRFPDMLQDLQRSLQLVKENADSYNIDPANVGVIGFSAGGHLACLSAIYFDRGYLEQLGITPRGSLRPDFVASIYPVVSMSAPCTHTRSRRGIMGDNRVNDNQLRCVLSLEQNLRKDMPPMFLLNCADDPTVNYHNSELLDEALCALHIPHKYIQYRTGGHGFGADPGRTSPEAIGWKDEFISWLNHILK